MTTKPLLPLNPLGLSIATGNENGPELPAGPHCIAHHSRLELTFEQLTADILRQIAPDTVASWLFCAQYDAYDVARILTDARFEGRYFAMAEALPHRAAIEREISHCFPGLQFRVLCPAPLSARVARYHKLIASARLSPEVAPA
jgi:hypothetical protein